MTDIQSLLLILVLGLSVAITRYLPFIVFRKTNKLPKFIDYLGRVLPAAMMGLLVIYCFKDYDYTDFMSVLPAFIASAIVIGLHLWRRNTILSISAGTIAYMILIRVM